MVFFMNKKHGLNQHPLYNKWTDMKTRCYNPKSQRYKNYGGRGITICGEWLNDFHKFYDWAMRNGWSDSLTIDRIDVNAGYSPSNCRIIGMSDQARNKTNSLLIEYHGQRVLFAELCNKKGMSERKMKTIYERIHTYKWDHTRAVDTPIRLLNRS